MNDSFDLDDDQLLGLIRESLRGEAAIEMAFALRDVDAAMATEIEDTALLTASSGVRDGVGTDRTVTFQLDDLFVEVSFDSATSDIHGQLLPARAEQVEIETLSARHQLPVDDLGRFSIHTDARQIRLRISTATGPVVTGWVFR